MEAESYLVILMYFILYWIYYPLPHAPFPHFLFSSLELIIVSPAFALLSGNDKIRETDFINRQRGNFLGSAAEQTRICTPINI